MTKGAQQFVTPLSVGALAADKVYLDLFDREDEHDVGHIRLARECDLVLVAPATADLMAKMANGLADDLASTILLATNAPVLIAPAMNPAMWSHPATRRNVEDPECRTAFTSSVQGPAKWLNPAKPARAAWPSRWRSSMPIGDLLDTRAKAASG